MYYLMVLFVITIYAPNYVFGVTAICPNKTLMENCVINAEDDWGIDRNDYKESYKNWCCFRWQAYHCRLDLGTKCTGKYDKKTHNSSMIAEIENIQLDCTEFPESSCSGLKWWAITLIVIASLIVAAGLGFLVFYLCVRNKSRRYSAPK